MTTSTQATSRREGSVAPSPALSESQKFNRVRWLDCARGIAAVLVVYNHVCMGLWTAGLPFRPDPYGMAAAILRGAIAHSPFHLWTIHRPIMPTARPAVYLAAGWNAFIPLRYLVLHSDCRDTDVSWSGKHPS